MIRVLIAEAGGKRPLTIYIYQENALTRPRQTDTQVDRRYGLANSALLIAKGPDFCSFSMCDSSTNVECLLSDFF